MIAQPATEKALWPQHTTASPSQKRWPSTQDMRHCACCWQAEGLRAGSPNTKPRTRTPPPPENTNSKKQMSAVSLLKARSWKLDFSLVRLKCSVALTQLPDSFPEMSENLQTFSQCTLVNSYNSEDISMNQVLEHILISYWAEGVVNPCQG